MKAMIIGIDATGPLASDTGGKTYLTYFVKTLAQMNLEDRFVIYLSSKADDIFDDLPSFIEKVFLLRKDVPYSKVIASQVCLPIQARQSSLDVMFHQSNFSSLLYRGPKVLAIRSMLQYHFPEAISRGRRFYRKFMTPLSARSANRIIVPSSSTCEDVQRFLGIQAEKITVIPHGVEKSFFGHKFSTDELNKTIAKLHIRRPFFLFVSALWSYKGADLLIHAYSITRKRMGDSCPQLVFVGDGEVEYISYLKRLCSDAQLNSDILFLGYLGHAILRKLYQAALALVYPSLLESFGHPLLEAMGSGVPILASNRGAVPEIVGDAGLIIDPTHKDAFAAGLFRLATDTFFRQALTERGHLRLQQFSWEKTVKDTLAIIRSAS